jgi:rfaE bifunctional protein kinase chain/domain
VKRLAAFPKVRVVVLGDLVADHYLYGQTERISREAPVLIVRHEHDEVKLGGGANAAANARALGGRVTVVGQLGTDEMGRALRGLCEAQGIVVQAVSAKGVSTETKLRILAGGLSTSRQQMLRVDRGVTGPLPSSLRRALATRLARAVEDADVVLVSDYGAGVVCDETRAVVREAAQRGVAVCVDSRFALGDFTGATLCKPNEPELGAMTGLSRPTPRSTERPSARWSCSSVRPWWSRGDARAWSSTSLANDRFVCRCTAPRRPSTSRAQATRSSRRWRSPSARAPRSSRLRACRTWRVGSSCRSPGPRR